MSILHPSGDEPDGSPRRWEPSDGIEVIDDDRVLDIDLTREPPRPTMRTKTVPSHRPAGSPVTTAPEPVRHERPVFSGNAAYRPITFAVAIAGAMVVVYGVVALAMLFVPNRVAEPAAASVDLVAPREIIGSIGSVAATTTCNAANGSLFVDSDANGFNDPWDPAHDFSGTRIDVFGPGGFDRTLMLDASGTWQLDLPVTGAAMVSIRDLTGLAAAGLWPGPRHLTSAGEESLVGKTCAVDLGLVWLPDDGAVPRPVSSSAPSLTPGEAGSVQLHGRLWTDLDADGGFDIDEPGRAGLQLELRDAAGQVVATATSSDDGLYAFANLAPSTRYSVSLGEGETAAAARFLGEPVDRPDRPVVFDTGGANLAVWGADFAIAEPGTTGGHAPWSLARETLGLSRG